MRSGIAAIAVSLGCAVLGCSSAGGDPGRDAGVFVASRTDAGSRDAQDAASGDAIGPGRIDRAGRPLVGVLLVGRSLEDQYNAAPTFDVPLSRTLQDALLSRVEALDTIALGDGGADGVDWPGDGGAQRLVEMLSTDALLVDTALSCVSPDGGFSASYLDLERELFLDGGAHSTCGGRTPGDRVVDAMLTLLVTGGRASVSQGVAGPTRSPMTTFPYLADPQ